MASETLLVAGTADVPLAYTVPTAGEAQPLCVSAKYDGAGAAGDYVPTLIIRSDGGIIMSEVPIGETVAAGDDARVTWAPFLRGASAGFPGLTSGGAWLGGGGIVIPSGVPTPIVFPLNTSFPGSQPPFRLDAAFHIVQPLELTEFRVWCQLAVTWPAGAYDRYIEFAPAGGVTATGEIHVRARGAATPTDDLQVIEAVETGDPSTPVVLNVRAFQASGVNQPITAEFVGYAWPRVLGGFYV